MRYLVLAARVTRACAHFVATMVAIGAMRLEEALRPRPRSRRRGL